MAMPTGETQTKELNLQARFEQLETGLNEAHAIVSRMAPRETDKMPEEGHESTASITGAKCQDSLSNLISRLEGLHDRVGVV